MDMVRTEAAAFAAGAVALAAAFVVPFTAACLAAGGIALSVGEMIHSRRLTR